MAYCGKCGAQNPDGATFCSACGSSLQQTVEIPLEPTQPPHREGAPTRLEQAMARKKVAQDSQQPQPRAHRSQPQGGDSGNGSAGNGGGKKPKKGGAGSGNLKKLLGWVILLAILLGLLTWGVKSCGGGSEEETDKQDPTTFERVMTDQQVDSLVAAMGFPKTTEDVAPLAGHYEATVGEYNVVIQLTPKQDGQVVGNVTMTANGYKAVRDGYYCYCGNSVYGIYEYKSRIEKGRAHSYFYVQPDRKSIVMVEDGKQYTLNRKVMPVQKGKGKGLLARDYQKCMDEAMAMAIAKREGFPETFDDCSIPFGTYSMKATVGKETHTSDVVLEPYDGQNLMIVARVSIRNDGKEEARGYIGYCGSCIYSLYISDSDLVHEDDVELNKDTKTYYFANADDKSMSIYEKGTEQVRLRADEVVTINYDKDKQ